MRRILWEEWRNADYTFTMTSKEHDLVCWWKRNHERFPALQKHLPKWKVRETEWEVDSTDLRSNLEGTHAQQLSLNCGGLRGLQCCIYCLLMLGISNTKSSFSPVWTLSYPWRVMVWQKTTLLVFPHEGRGHNSRSSPCRPSRINLPTWKEIFPQLGKNKQWHSFQLILLYVHICFHCLLSLFPTPNQFLMELLYYSMETAYVGRCCSLWLLIARRSRAGVQLTASANVKWQGLWSQGNNRGPFYFPELPEKLSG